MHRLPRLIDLILANPTSSDRRVADMVGCDPRRVRRYRRLVAHALDIKWATPEDLRGCPRGALNRFFNPRRRRRRHATPDYRALIAANPDANGRALWQTYVAQQRAAGLGAMSYVSFMRRKKAA